MFAHTAWSGKQARGPHSILRAGTDSPVETVARRWFDGGMTERETRARLLQEGDRRLVRAVDGLSEEQLRGPSLLPGWSRAHVVAHVALNGEALEQVLVGLREGEEVSMYASQEARDGDIEELAAAEPAQLRDRLMRSVSVFAEAEQGFPDDLGDHPVPRVPGGPSFPARGVLLMRWREIEIHHADLDAGYTSDDWGPEFTVAVLDSMRARAWPSGFRVLARDLARTWDYGPDGAGDAGPAVSGESRDLAWWVTGRGDGSTLTADGGDLPEVPSW